MRLICTIILLIPFLVYSQMKEDGVGPGASVVFAEEEVGLNLRFHYFPSHKMCFGLETNIFPQKGEDLSEGMEVTLNGHYIIAAF